MGSMDIIVVDKLILSETVYSIIESQSGKKRRGWKEKGSGLDNIDRVARLTDHTV